MEIHLDCSTELCPMKSIEGDSREHNRALNFDMEELSSHPHYIQHYTVHHQNFSSPFIVVLWKSKTPGPSNINDGSPLLYAYHADPSLNEGDVTHSSFEQYPTIEKILKIDNDFLWNHLSNPLFRSSHAGVWPVAYPQSYTLYFLQQVPTAESLGINLKCTRSAPLVRAFNDYVFYTIAFEAKDYCLLCNYTTTKSGGTVFILWQPSCKKGVTDFLPREMFTLRETIGKIEMKEIDLLLSSSSMIGSIKQSSLPTKRQSCWDDRSIKTDGGDWDLLVFIFSPLSPDLDGLYSSIANSELGHFEKKAQYLRIKAMWTRSIEEAADRNLPYAQNWLLALWLHISGCPENICDEEDLLQDVSNIARRFPNDEIPAVDFGRALEDAGYRRPFSRMVAKCLSSDVGVLSSFTEIIGGVSTPFRLNSFLCISNEVSDDKVYYKSHVTESTSGELKTSDAEPCFISLSGSDFKMSLGACAFKAVDDQWYPRNFAEFTYEKISQLLRDFDNHIVFGHVTSEQSIIDMCLKGEDGDELLQGMSVLASHENKNSCGCGMYFFRISEVGDFKSLSSGQDNDLYADLVHEEFQGFMYALTRAFQGLTHSHHLTPAVLLAAVPKPAPNFFKNACDQVLPLLNNAAVGGCSCVRRYTDNFDVDRVPVSNSAPKPGATPTIHDRASVLQACVGDDQCGDQIERLNALTLRYGAVNLQETGAFEAFISDGSALGNLKPFSDNDLKDCESKGKLDLKKFSGKMGFQKKDGKSWRRPMLIFDKLGNFTIAEPMKIPTSMKDAENKQEVFLKPPHWQSVALVPKEYVFTWQSVLNDLFRQAKSFSVVFVHPEVKSSKDTRERDCWIRMSPSDLAPGIVRNISTHAYFVQRRMCQDRNCTRTDDDRC